MYIKGYVYTEYYLYYNTPAAVHMYVKYMASTVGRTITNIYNLS